MSRRSLRLAVLAAATVSALLIAGCASDDAPGGGTSSPDAGADAYVTPGKLTIATGEPAYEPYVVGDDPASGEGFEAEVAYAVAEELGFAPEDVVWVRTTFESAIAPGPKNFDLNIQQYTITDERREAVDFSTPYYRASQAIVALEGSPITQATSLADLKGFVFGTMVGTTSAQTIDDVIQPDATPLYFNTNDEARAALESGQIDGFVLDLPTAFFATAVYIEGSVIVGELPVAGVPDEWGFVLPKDSPLTADVSAAVDRLRADGTLDEITERWLGSGAGVPLLE